MERQLTPNNRLLKLTSATELEIEQLKLCFNKKIDSRKRDPRVKKGHWDGVIHNFKGDYLAAGLWMDLVDISKKYNFNLKIEGIERKFDYTINQEEFTNWVNEKWAKAEKKPRDYQIESAFKIIKYKCCLAELATSAGKTLMTYMILSYLLDKGICKKVLMVVPNVDLVLQGAEDFYEYNRESVELDLEIQQIYAGSKIRNNANIVIGTYQSLTKKDAEFFDDYDCVVIDESHSAKNVSVKSILEKCKCDRRFGISGTFPKEGTLNRITIMSHTGPIISTIRADFLMKEGYISTCKVVVLELNYADKETKEAFKRIYESNRSQGAKVLKLEQNYCIENKTRLQFIIDSVLRVKKNSLILFYRIEYGNKLYDALRLQTDRKIFYIDGGVDKDLRGIQKDELEEGEGKIMIASYGTFAQGINVKNIHNIFLTESFKSDTIIRQSIGRGLRLHAQKDNLLILDFVDDFRVGNYENYLYEHSTVRQEIYREQNFPYTIKQINLLK